MLPKYPFQVRVRRKISNTAGAKRLEEVKSFQTAPAAMNAHEAYKKQPLIVSVQFLVVVEEWTRGDEDTGEGGHGNGHGI